MYDNYNLNFNEIKKRIDDFKIRDKFEENEYFSILEDLEKLYNQKKGNSLLFWNKDDKIILNEKNLFKKYLVFNLFTKVEFDIKSQKYEKALISINKLEKLGKLEEYNIITDLEKHKIFCETKINSKYIDDLLKEKKYEEAIKRSKSLVDLSQNYMQNLTYSMKLNESKGLYIKNILEENISFLKSEPYIVINNCEKILKEFQYESKLKTLIFSTKKLYANALEIFIEEKLKKNEECMEQYEKYKSLIETNNIKENRLNEFNEKILTFFKHKEQNENNKINKINNVYYLEYNPISKEIINNYLEKIKIINDGKINENIEKDILTQIYNYNEELMKDHGNIKNWLSNNNNNIKNNKFRGNVFAVFNLVNKKIIGYDIYPIQLISLLILTSDEPKLGGKFLQINTGEGKSLIIQFLAAYLSLLGNKVDIITSSVVLADRDAEDKNNINFYNELGLSVGTASKDQYSNDIVYGDTQNFQSGILREEFKGKEIRKGRPFNCIIIDEVDSISLDNIVSMTQLTEYFPGRSSFYFFYYQILMCYCHLVNELPEKQEYCVKHPKEFKEIISNGIKNRLIGKILEEDGKTLKIDSPIIYPKTMKKYIEDSIDVWINNVIKAPSMIENKDFIIINNSIIPVDYLNTGVRYDNMIWDGGLQQILQIIHNVKGTYENENTNFLSNISFFKRYNNNIYGVTGTFGGENFQYILREIYKINLFKIPPNKTSIVINEGGIVCIDEEIYKNKILDDIKQKILMNSSVLLICNSIARKRIL